MSQVFMTVANKGLVEFSIMTDVPRDSRLLRVDYKVYTPADPDAVRTEFRQVIGQALGYIVSDEQQENGLNRMCLVPAQINDLTIETLAG